MTLTKPVGNYAGEVRARAMRETRFVGVDLGQASDHTALAIVERIRNPNPEHDPEIAAYARMHRKPGFKYAVPQWLADDYHMLALHRFQLGILYPNIRKTLQKVIDSPQMAGSRVALAIDGSGPGRSMVDELRSGAEGSRLEGVDMFVPVTITTGQSENSGKMGYWNVARNILVGEAKKLLGWGRLKMSPDLPHGSIFAEELRSFRPRQTHTGNVVFEAVREGDHDDLIFAVSLALWVAIRRGDGQVRTIQRALR